MPLLQKPALTTISVSKTDIEYAISFAYNFNGDTVINSNIGGQNFNGSIYTFSALNIPNSPANLPPFRSLLFSQTFNNVPSSTQPDFDGPLLIFMPQSGLIQKFGCPVVDNNPAVGVQFPSRMVVTGCIPIIANSPTSIQFCKQVVEFTSPNLSGVLTATLSTKVYNPFAYGSIVG